MADGRRNNGGHSTKGRAGRKPKAEEQRIRDLTSPHVPGAIQTVVNIMMTAEKDADRLAAAKLMLSYHYGNPKTMVDVTTGGDKVTGPPIFNVVIPENAECLKQEEE